jgi:prepilin-type N-terminal cleavage/methylation domain-containing protein
MQKQKAFTLSETLITLAVLGIIAAAVIPALITTTNKNNYVNGLKRADLMLKTATSELMADNSGTMQNLVSTDNDHIGMVNKYCSKLNCIKKCSAGAISGNCFPVLPIKNLQGTDYTNYNLNNYEGAVLSNGMMIVVQADKSNSCNWVSVTKNGNSIGCSSINIDINGFKGPNTFGRDIFMFVISKNGIVPYGIQNTFAATAPYIWTNATTGWCTLTSTQNANGYACAGRILTEGKMNY